MPHHKPLKPLTATKIFALDIYEKSKSFKSMYTYFKEQLSIPLVGEGGSAPPTLAGLKHTLKHLSNTPKSLLKHT